MRLKARGIRRIDGRIIGDDDLLEEPRPALAWAWDDLGYTSGALFGALNLAENRMTVTVTPAGSAGARRRSASTRRRRPRVRSSIESSPASVARLQLVWPEQRPGETSLTIAGSIPVGASRSAADCGGRQPNALVRERVQEPADRERHRGHWRSVRHRRRQSAARPRRRNGAPYTPVSPSRRDRSTAPQGEHQPVRRGRHETERLAHDDPDQRRRARRDCDSGWRPGAFHRTASSSSMARACLAGT